MDAPAEIRIRLEGGGELVATRREGMLYAISFTALGSLVVPTPDPEPDPDPKPGTWPEYATVVTDFGAKGDGQTDDTVAIQRALDSGNPHVAIPPGTYLVRGAGKGTNDEPEGALMPRSGTTLWAEGAKIQLAGGQKPFTSIVVIKDVKGVVCRGGLFDGVKDRQTKQVSSQDGAIHGFVVHGSTNITLQDLEIAGCFVDGILLRRKSRNVTLERVKAIGNRRQGMSISNVYDIVAKHCTFAGTKGQAPESGVDIEPDSATQDSANILFEDCLFKDNATSGFLIHTKAPLIGLTLRRCRFEGNRRRDHVDLSLGNFGALIEDVLIEDCDIPGRIHIGGQKPHGTFKNWVIRNNRLRGPHAAIKMYGFTPASSMRIAGNKIASGRPNPFEGTSQPGLEIGDNDISAWSE